MQLVSLQPRTLLLVVVLSSGSVEKHVFELTEDVDDAQAATTTAVLDSQLRGRPWSRLPELQPTGDPAVDELAAFARGALVSPSRSVAVEPLYVGGVSRLAAEQEAFEAAGSAARLLEMLEHQVIVVSLVRELLDAGLTVSIGAENQLDELRDCSIVLSPYSVDGRPVGVVGVLGPTRMDYRHALAAVSTVSRQLGQHLS